MSQFKDGPELQAKCCWALSNVTCTKNSENQTFLRKHGALSLGMTALTYHRTATDVATHALAFFSHVVEENREVCESAVSIGLLPRAVVAMCSHEQESTVQQFGCALFSHAIEAGAELAGSREDTLRLVDQVLLNHSSEPRTLMQVNDLLSDAWFEFNSVE